MWLLYAFFSAIGAAAVAIFAKLGLQNIDSTLATTVRAVIMASFLVVVSIFLNKFKGFSLHSFSSREWLLIAAAGIAGALSWLFYFLAIKYGVTTGVVAVDRLSVVLVVLLAAIFLGEALSWLSVLGALMMTLGAILITLK